MRYDSLSQNVLYCCCEEKFKSNIFTEGCHGDGQYTIDQELALRIQFENFCFPFLFFFLSLEVSSKIVDVEKRTEQRVDSTGGAV